MPLVCRVELNKTSGITITVDNADGNILQTIVMDGTSITTTVKGQQNTSTIVQKEDSIVITCKDFKVNAETIFCKSTGKTTHKSLDAMDIISSQDMKLESSANLTEKATSDVSISGMNVKADATMDAKINGLNVNVKGTSELKASGGQLALSGTIQAKMSGPMVELAGDAMTTVKGSLTSLEGQLTTVKGSLVKIGS